MNKTAALTLAAVVGLSASMAQADDHGKAAVANIHNNDGDAIGEVHLRQGPNGVLLSLELDGLPEGMKAIHIHQNGDCSDPGEGFMASGGHLNPDERKHGLMNPEGPDAADLPNFYVHEDGFARAEFFNARVSLDGSMGAQVLDESGAALVIHESSDDHASQPIGGAGARLACGVIEGL